MYLYLLLDICNPHHVSFPEVTYSTEEVLKYCEPENLIVNKFEFYDGTLYVYDSVLVG